MICSKCNSKWESQSNIDKCPLCGTKLIKGTQENKTLSDGIKEIVSIYGVDIFLESKKLLSLIMDFVQGCEREKKMIRIAINHGITNSIYRICKTDDEDERKLIIQKTEKSLQDDAFLSKENAQYIINLLLQGIDITVSFEKNSHKFNTWDEIISEANNNDCYAQFIAGRCYSRGILVKQDFDSAILWYKKAASNGLDWAKYCVGTRISLNRNASDEDLEYAAEQFASASENGHVWATTNYGNCIKRGKGVKKSESMATEYYQKASNPNENLSTSSIETLETLIAMCENVESLHKDLSKILNEYVDDARNGHKIAQCILAICYQTGQGVQPDYSKSVNLLNSLVDRKYYMACFELGYCYEKGIGVTKNKNESQRLYQLGEKLAPEQGWKYYTTEDFKRHKKMNTQ